MDTEVTVDTRSIISIIDESIKILDTNKELIEICKDSIEIMSKLLINTKDIDDEVLDMTKILLQKSFSIKSRSINLAKTVINIKEELTKIS